MKGIVIEKGSDYSVLLLSDGTFRNIRSCKSCEVGDVIYTTGSFANESLASLRKVISMISAAFFILFLGTAAYLWATPVQYINIDINPSVELMINRLDRIIKVNSLNDDGKKLVEKISVNARHYEAGVIEVINAARNLGYLEDENDILISISSSDMKLIEKTQEKIKEKVDDKIAILTFDTETYRASVEKGLSPGKSDIINKVIETDTSLSREELAAVQVKDLMAKINDIRSTEEYENEQGSTGIMSIESSYNEDPGTDVEEQAVIGNNAGNAGITDTAGLPDETGNTNNSSQTGNALNDNEPGAKKDESNSNSNKGDKNGSKDKNEKNSKSKTGKKDERESNTETNKNVKNGKDSKARADSRDGNNSKAEKNEKAGKNKTSEDKKEQNKENKDNGKNNGSNAGSKTQKKNNRMDTREENDNKDDDNVTGKDEKGKKVRNNGDSKKPDKENKDKNEKTVQKNNKGPGSLNSGKKDKNAGTKGKSEKSKIRR